MDGKYKKEKNSKKKYEKKARTHRGRSSSSSSTSVSDEWVEKTSSTIEKESKRDEWMAMTGMLKTYTKDDIKPKPKQEEKSKRYIDSYNPSTSSRELNPYWKDGGTGLPQTSEEFRKSKPFLKPVDNDDNFYTKLSSSKNFRKPTDDFDYKSKSEQACDREQNTESYKITKNESESYSRKSYNWKKDSRNDRKSKSMVKHTDIEQKKEGNVDQDDSYLSDEKMNKLAAKIVKAEILGDSKLVKELKEKLEKARQYRKQNPNKEDKDNVMLISTNSAGNSKPLSKVHDNLTSHGGKRKAETHTSGQRMKYFGNDDKYNLAQMFQNEKYSDNYDDEAQLAKIAANKNPNDDLEDIFMDEISKNRNEAKDSEKEKQRAINQHVRMEKSLEGCEYCVDSKNMLKHLIVSCGNKVYVALPARKSLVKGHCIITTIQHNICVTALDEDVWEEILNYRKALTQFFNSQNKDVVFYETAIKLHRFPHVIINCVPIPRDVGDVASIYFKKALLECETEWSMNKKVIDLKGKNIRKGIPKGLSYFWIDFGMDPGFAHVIEDQQLFSKTFGEEIIAGILDIDHSVWKNPQKEYGDIQRKKVLEFLKEWKLFDPAVKTKI